MINYQCTKCERVRSGDGLTDTLAPGIKLGYCLGCAKKGTFRAVDKAADRDLGKRLADRGMDKAETAEALTGDWVERADAELKRLARTGDRFTAETLTGAVGRPSHHNALGARFNAAARQGLIRKVGYTNANRSAAHSRGLAVWQGVSE